MGGGGGHTVKFFANINLVLILDTKSLACQHKFGLYSFATQSKCTSCNKSVDIFQLLVINKPISDAFAWLAITC